MPAQDKILYTPLGLKGVFGIQASEYLDHRGSLFRLWDKEIFPVEFNIFQISYITNPRSGTLRGLHFQIDPFEEAKVIQCVSGKVFDVLIDLRKTSDTYGAHLEVEIGPNSLFQGLIVPVGFAHGYLTLESNSDLIYFTDKAYSSKHSRGIIWSDSGLGINWPEVPEFISERDKFWPTFNHE